MQVPWLDAVELVQPVGLPAAVVGHHRDVVGAQLLDHTGRSATITSPASTAARSSMPVPTSGDSLRSSGTAWRCMFAPISARLASSCSRNGIIAVATETIWRGDTSM